MVLAPVDFSDATPRVVEEAANLAQALDGYVVLLHVARLPERMPHYPTQMAHLAATIQEIEAAADQGLLELKENLRQRGVATQSLRLTGEPTTDIVEQAEKLKGRLHRDGIAWPFRAARPGDREHHACGDRALDPRGRCRSCAEARGIG